MSSIEKEICGALVSLDILKAEPPDDDMALRGLGMDSLGFLQLFDWLEEKYGVKVDDSEMNPATVGTVTLLAELVRRKQPCAS